MPQVARDAPAPKVTALPPRTSYSALAQSRSSPNGLAEMTCVGAAGAAVDGGADWAAHPWAAADEGQRAMTANSRNGRQACVAWRHLTVATVAAGPAQSCPGG